MSRLVHLVRHGEVDNPRGVLYGRLPGFHLSPRGHAMARVAADHLAPRRIDVIRSSPLERAVESATPLAEATGLEIERRDGLLEASSRLEGGRYAMSLSILAKPGAWPYLINPMRPSWGEPFVDVAARMRAELDDAFALPGDGDVVLVSHQLPIWMAHRSVTGQRLFHDPRKRRCTLSSITSFALVDGVVVESGYEEPARPIDDEAVDVGAV